MKDAMEMVGAVSAVAKDAQQAARDYPSGFAIGGIISLLLRELIAYALRKGPPAGLAEFLGVTEAQAQKIREAVLTRELARVQE